MTQKEKAEKAAWYIGAVSDYEYYNDNWYDIFLRGKGDCMASRYALQYMCNHMGIKAVAFSSLDEHGKTLIYADGKFYVVITGFNEPRPRQYMIYEISGEALEQLAGHGHASGEFIKLDNVFDVIYRNFHTVYSGNPEEGQELFFQILMSRNLTPEQRADILINGTVRK